MLVRRFADPGSSSDPYGMKEDKGKRVQDCFFGLKLRKAKNIFILCFNFVFLGLKLQETKNCMAVLYFSTPKKSLFAIFGSKLD